MVKKNSKKTKKSGLESYFLSTFRGSNQEAQRLNKSLSTTTGRVRTILKTLPEPVAQHRFTEVRGWRFDFAWPTEAVALDIQGGTFMQGGHSRGLGYENDCDKANAAALLGWTFLHVTGHQVKDGRALQAVRVALWRAQEPEAARATSDGLLLPPYLRVPPVRGKKGTFHTGLPGRSAGRGNAGSAGTVSPGPSTAGRRAPSDTSPTRTGSRRELQRCHVPIAGAIPQTGQPPRPATPRGAGTQSRSS